MSSSYSTQHSHGLAGGSPAYSSHGDYSYGASKLISPASYSGYGYAGHGYGAAHLGAAKVVSAAPIAYSNYEHHGDLYHGGAAKIVQPAYSTAYLSKPAVAKIAYAAPAAKILSTPVISSHGGYGTYGYGNHLGRVKLLLKLLYI